MDRAIRKQEAPQQKGIIPPFASPALAPTIFCSAIPTFTNRLGNLPLNAFSFVEPTESFTTAQTRSSTAAISASVDTNASRQSNVAAFFATSTLIARPSSIHRLRPPVVHPLECRDATPACSPYT